MHDQHQNAAVSLFNTNNNKLDSSSLSRIQSDRSKNEDEELSVKYSSNLSNNESLSYSMSRNPSAMPNARMSNRQPSDKEKSRISTPKQGEDKPSAKEAQIESKADGKSKNEVKVTQKRNNSAAKRPKSGVNEIKIPEGTKGEITAGEDKGQMGVKKTVRPNSVSSKEQNLKKP